ncbi:MAG: hypothetical protein IAE63_06810 [Alphaproteobacteria bacterium]|nr:hypothetical protein [Alphaproteobacteria bacterium]
MSQNPLGNNTPQGFLPALPSVNDILSRLSAGDQGWSGLAAQSQPDNLSNSEKEQLLKDYILTFSTEHGARVLEDLLNMTLRTAPLAPEALDSFEKGSLYMAEKKGQNGIVVAILKRIVDGRNLPSPAQKKAKKSAKK